jgi:hypothetical protein
MDTKIVQPSRVGIAAKGAPGKLTVLMTSAAGVPQVCACAAAQAIKTAKSKNGRIPEQILVRMRPADESQSSLPSAISRQSSIEGSRRTFVVNVVSSATWAKVPSLKREPYHRRIRCGLRDDSLGQRSTAAGEMRRAAGEDYDQIPRIAA